MHDPDLVLLDVAMPVMDGLTCLERLRANPTTAHIPVIMLTAMSEREQVVKAARLGIQGYLLKSQFSTAELLKCVAELIGAARTSSTRPPDARLPERGRSAASAEENAAAAPEFRMEKSEVLKRVRRQLELRPVPPVLEYVIAQTNNESASIDEVVSTIRQDQALALRVMTVANSSFYATVKQADNLTKAAQRIGMSGIRNAVVAIVAMDHFGDASEAGLIPQRFWEHALASGALAQLIAEAVGSPDAEQLFLAGLLHDIGRLLLGSVFPSEYRALLDSVAQMDGQLVSRERELFGLSHADVSKEALIHLKLPDAVVAAASAHELESEQLQVLGRDSQGALVVALANRLAHACLLGTSGDGRLLAIRDFADALALTPSRIQSIANEAVDKASDTALFYVAQTGVVLLEPLAVELAGNVRREIRVAVVSGDDTPADPLTLFCGRLGWLDCERPDFAIVHAPQPSVLSERFGQLKSLEQSTGRELPVLLASPGAAILPPNELLQGRQCANVSMPDRYTEIVRRVDEFAGAVVSQDVNSTVGATTPVSSD